MAALCMVFYDIFSWASAQMTPRAQHPFGENIQLFHATWTQTQPDCQSLQGDGLDTTD